MSLFRERTGCLNKDHCLEFGCAVRQHIQDEIDLFLMDPDEYLKINGDTMSALNLVMRWQCDRNNNDKILEFNDLVVAYCGGGEV